MKKQNVKITLFKKLFISFAVLTILPLSVLYFAINLSLMQLNEISQERMKEKRSLINVEFELLGQEIQQKVDFIKRSSEIMVAQRAIMNNTFVQADFLNTGAQLMTQSGLDFLDILDDQGKIRSSGHWPMAWDKIEMIDLDSAQSFPEQPVFRWEEFMGQRVISLQVASKTQKQKDVYLIICGGIQIEERLFLEHLNKKVEALLFFYNPHDNVLIYPKHMATFIETDDEQLRKLGQSSFKQTPRKPLHNVYLSRKPYHFDVIPLREGPVLQKTNGEILGYILLGLSLEQLQKPQRTLKNAIIPLSLSVLIISLLVSLFLSRRITRPVQSLVAGTSAVAAGNLEHNIPVTSQDEIGLLVKSFNQMTMDLAENKKNLIVAERVAAWQEIARRLAHEIKNPLSPILLSIQTLQKTYRRQHPDFDEIFWESTAAINEEVQSLKRIVNEFAEFARMPKPNPEKTNINQIIQTTVNLYVGVSSSVTITQNLSLELPPCEVDRELISQVLKNLIGNAIEATPEGVSIDISTDCKQADESSFVLITVADDGIGMTTEECEQVFRPYYTTKKGGTGLGLSIAHRIITDHGGSISLVSEPGKGTIFTIELPALQEGA
ncbi:PAS domain-containing sensor histidine kinase [candidate division CSSED10-310 bacterium]|uniref:histidine kinase n=1 Tax=candidate division CSSED10-310 bacterium TaxID=2855610 RepID=A0ABV6Z407_UNCC1